MGDRAEKLRDLKAQIERLLEDEAGSSDEDCDAKYRRRHHLSEEKLTMGDLFNEEALAAEGTDIAHDREIDNLNDLKTKQIRRAFRKTYIGTDENDLFRPAYRPRNDRCPPGTRAISWDKIKHNKDLIVAVASLLGAQVFRIDRGNKHYFCVNEPAFARVTQHIARKQRRHKRHVERHVRNAVKQQLETLKVTMRDGLREIAGAAKAARDEARNERRV